MGRSAAKVESAEELAQQPGGLGDSARVLAPVALPLDPSRISFIEIPEFHSRPLLGPENRRRFEYPLLTRPNVSP